MNWLIVSGFAKVEILSDCAKAQASWNSLEEIAKNIHVLRKIKSYMLEACQDSNSVSTGIPKLVRFFGPQATALFEKPH